MDTEKALGLAKIQLKDVNFAIEQIKKSSHKRKESILVQAIYLRSSLEKIIEKEAEDSSVWQDLSGIQNTFKTQVLKIKPRKQKR